MAKSVTITLSEYEYLKETLKELTLHNAALEAENQKLKAEKKGDTEIDKDGI